MYDIMINKETFDKLHLIIKRCSKCIIDSIFTFSENLPTFKLDECQLLERFEIINKNENKKIAIIIKKETPKLKTLHVYQNVFIFIMNAPNLQNLIVRSNCLFFSDIFCQQIPHNIERIGIQMFINKKLIFDLANYPKLKEVCLNIIPKDENAGIAKIITSKPCYNINRINIMGNIKLQGYDYANLENFTITHASICQKVIDIIPKNVKMLNIGGKIVNSSVINIKHFPLLKGISISCQSEDLLLLVPNKRFTNICESVYLIN